MPGSAAMATPVALTSAAKRNTAATMTAMPDVGRGREPSHPATTARYPIRWIGCSTKRKDTTSATNVMASAIAPRVQPPPLRDRDGSAAVTSTHTGQCQRYRPYDRSPIQRSGRQSRAAQTGEAREMTAPAIASTVSTETSTSPPR